MKTKQNKSDAGIEGLGKAIELLRKVADELVSEWEYVDVEDSGIDKLSAAADQLRELAREVVAQRLGKPETGKKVEGVPVASEELLSVASEFGKDVKREHGLMLGAIEILLAGADFLSWDTVKSLQEQRDSLQGGMQSQTFEDESEENAEAENGEVQAGPEYLLEDCEGTIERIERALSQWVPLKQTAVLKHVLSLMPERQREHEAETAANEACDEFINYIGHSKNRAEEKAFYQEALAAVKAGNGVVELKQTA